jgi:hypothetical protein
MLQKSDSLHAIGNQEQLDGIIGSEKGFLRQAAVTLIVFDQENSDRHTVSSDYPAVAKKTGNYFNKFESDISTMEVSSAPCWKAAKHFQASPIDRSLSTIRRPAARQLHTL